MKFIDLSRKLKNNINPYPGDPKFNIKYIDNVKYGESNLSKLNTSLHTGTHIDSPFHYYNNGFKVDNINLDNTVGMANILDCSNIKPCQKIKVGDIKNLPENFEKIVIIKTLWSNNFGSDEYFYKNSSLDSDLIDLLVKNKVKLIAIDTSSPDFFGENKNHRTLLKNNILIVENLCNLDNLTKDKYYSYFIPLNIHAEASPIRAFVRNE